MQKLILPTALILVLTFFACKKKEATLETLASSAPSGVTAPNGLVLSTGGDLCNLQTSYMYSDHSSVVTKDSLVFASFYSAPVSLVLPTYVSGGTVTLNGINIPYQGSSYYISNNLPTAISGTITWSVSGSGTVTAFSQSFIPNYPKYTGGNLLPDTCLKANGITINISGVTNNHNSVGVSLNSGSSSTFKYITSSNGTITFSASELSAFPTNSQLLIIINLSNIYSAALGGTKRGFANTLQYTKYSYLKP